MTCAKITSLPTGTLDVFDGMFIGGKWVPPVSSKNFFDVFNPATEELIYKSPAGNNDDVEAAVSSARQCFDSGVWSACPSAHRKDVLLKMASLVRANRDALGLLETLNSGKPLAESLVDIDDTANCFEFYANMTSRMDEVQQVDVGDAKFECLVVREPKGVCVAIVPWNYPALMATWKIAPCLASGCSLVLKPSEFTPLTVMALAAISLQAGVPAGAFNVVLGTGRDVGGPLSSRGDVDKIAFTGSVATGSLIMSQAAKNVIPVTLELGGKSAMIVFEDVNVPQVVEWSMIGTFYCAGQVCSATARIMVQSSIYDRFLATLQGEANALAIGPGTDATSQLGPVVSKAQYDRVMEYINIGKAEGLRLVCGGGRPANHPTTGFYIQPTVFADVPITSRLWKEEIFGPVICVRRFDTEAEAITEANNTTFGLAGAVMSQDIERCRRVSSKIKVGVMWENCSQPCFTQLPWSGVKRSGIGIELGHWGLDNFTSVKQIVSYKSKDLYGWYPQKHATTKSSL
eukprot:PhF_6_TR19064/c0_g1_i1/m.28025/K00130/betB, gbsA; betaine-aldehyde dehydrogenase